MKTLNWIFLILLVVGGLNRALVGLFNFDLVGFIFAPMSVVSRVIYTLVGVGAVWTLVMKLKE